MNYLYLTLIGAGDNYKDNFTTLTSGDTVRDRLSTITGNSNRWWSIVAQDNNANSASGFVICKSSLDYEKFTFSMTSIVKEFYPKTHLTILQIGNIIKMNASVNEIIKATEGFINDNDKLSDKEKADIVERLLKEEMVLNTKREYDEKLSNETKSSKSKLEAKIKELEASKKEEMELYKATKDKEYQALKDSLLEQDKLSKTVMVDENEVSIVKDICLSKIFVYKAYMSLYEDLITSKKKEIVNIKRFGYLFIIPMLIIIATVASILLYSTFPPIIVISILSPAIASIFAAFIVSDETDEIKGEIRRLKDDSRSYSYSDLESYLNDLKFKMSLAQFDKIKTTIIKQYNVSVSMGLFTSDQVDKRALELQSKRVENMEVNKLLNS